MITRDIVLIIVMFFPGAYLLGKSMVQFNNVSITCRLVTGYTRIHRAWTGRLIDSGWVSFPGIRLTDPIKSWACAEICMFMTIFIGISFSNSLGSVLSPFPLGFIAGSSVLYLSLKSESRRTVSIFQQDLPLAAFLMSLLIESGLGPAAALRETVMALPARGCANELNDILKGRELGLSKHDLFEGSRNRVPIDDYRGFLNLLEQGERLGIGLSQGLNELSRRILETQSHRAELLAQQAAVKMLLPLVMFIFPAVFLIVLSPVILNLCSMAGW